MSARQCVAIVTGANKGIGLAIVRALCKRLNGYIYLTSRNEARGQNAIKDLETEGLHPQFHLLDVTSLESIRCLQDYVISKHGGVDIFVHNAGIAYTGNDEAAFSEQASVTVSTNFTSLVNLCDTFLPTMEDEGRFITLSSMVAKMALNKCSLEVQTFFKSPDLSEVLLLQKMDEFVQAAQYGNHEAIGFPSMAYGMSKLGVTAYTRIMGRKMRENNRSNTLINCACPGYVKTEMTNHRGTRTPDQGAKIPIYLSTLPKGLKEPSGEFFCKDRLDKWYS
uniref:carbonyl reductase [NADPH] 1-like n=1 Tax=Styela clava TaxID=7725 RepID=UPI00193949E8|nr:carbonyl reductase [NADPH] 1-like [Styela clava]